MKNTEFCQKLLSFFDNSSKEIVDLIVALASNGNAKSVTELALNPLFFFKYSSISNAIDNLFKYKAIETSDEKIRQAQYLIERFEFDKKLQTLFKDDLPAKWKQKYRLLNNDVTSIFRPYSPTLENKEFVYAANQVVKGNKPVNIGFRLSTIGLSAREDQVAWNLPLSMLRVPVDMKSNSFAAKQIEAIVSNKELFEDDFFVCASDSAYCYRNFIHPNWHLNQLINIIRIAGHRNVSYPFKGVPHTGSGAPTRYGNIFKLGDADTHTQPDKIEEFEITLKKGNRQCKVVMKQWNDMLIRGSRTEKMHDKPFQLISVNVIGVKTNEPVFKKTLWLTVWGQKRNELSLTEIYEAFRLRFDIEFFFRFGKQRLLLAKYQTPKIEHLDNWFHIIELSYWLLYVNRKEGENIIRDWEKYLPKYKDQDVKEPNESLTKSPTQTQRAISGIISEFAKNNLIPKTRKNSPGRQKGETQTPKKRFEVVKKGKKKQILVTSP
jgi:hypothetical protein